MRLATSIKRLRQLADLLDRVPEEKFDMSHWARHLPPGMDPSKEEECGTSACALGWATTLPFAKALGARIEPHAYFNPTLGLIYTNKNSDEYLVIEEMFGDWRDLRALFFGVNVKPQEKAEEIREFCNDLLSEAKLKVVMSSRDIPATTKTTTNPELCSIARDHKTHGRQWLEYGEWVKDWTSNCLWYSFEDAERVAAERPRAYVVRFEEKT